MTVADPYPLVVDLYERRGHRAFWMVQRKPHDRLEFEGGPQMPLGYDEVRFPDAGH